jgi:hypothetical protein
MEPQAPQAIKVPQVFKVWMEPLVSQAIKEPQEQAEYRAKRVPQVLLV